MPALPISMVFSIINVLILLLRCTKILDLLIEALFIIHSFGICGKEV
jgi:hypothetical protein